MTSASVTSAASARFSLEPVVRRALGDDVLETLRQAIIAGTFASGDHLAEAALARQLGVSRAPVREAMMQLEREGLLLFDRRGAALVKAFTEHDFAEIFSLRLTLETEGARLAARSLEAEDVLRIEANIERTRAAKQLVEVTLLDVEFHDLIMQSARHTRLYACWNDLRHQIEVWLARMHSARDASPIETREETARHHRRLLTTLRAGREEKAATAMHAHIQSWGRKYPPPKRASGRRVA